MLSASHRSLDDLVAAKKMREDLYYRLNVLELEVPALRERREDIPLLVEHILAAEVRRPEVTPRAMAALIDDFDWPGNVRQLENELRRAALLAESTIDLDALSPALRAGGAATGRRRRPEGGLQQELETYERKMIRRALEEAGYNVSAAAELLQIHRVALHRKLKRLGIRRPARPPVAPQKRS